jgi:hypothetical protein
MTNEDRAMLIRAVEGVSEIRTNVVWIKENLQSHSNELRDHRKQLSKLRSYIYMGVGGIGSLQVFALLKSFLLKQ